jgi:hypothetical protein
MSEQSLLQLPSDEEGPADSDEHPGGPPEGKIHRVNPDFGSTLTSLLEAVNVDPKSGSTL